MPGRDFSCRVCRSAPELQDEAVQYSVRPSEEDKFLESLERSVGVCRGLRAGSWESLLTEPR